MSRGCSSTGLDDNTAHDRNLKHCLTSSAIVSGARRWGATTHRHCRLPFQTITERSANSARYDVLWIGPLKSLSVGKERALGLAFRTPKNPRKEKFRFSFQVTKIKSFAFVHKPAQGICDSARVLRRGQPPDGMIVFGYPGRVSCTIPSRVRNFQPLQTIIRSLIQ